MNTAHLYVHSPFCRRKCPYCDFYSVRQADTVDNDARRYYAAVCREWDVRRRTGDMPPPHPAWRTVFFGGGTPSLVPPERLEAVAQAVGMTERAGAARDAFEGTIEINPESLTPEKMSAYRQMGFNRFSVGIQSFHDADLAFLERVHDAEQGRKVVEMLTRQRETEAISVSMDLIYAIPGQTPERWRQTLTQAIDLGVDHISAYGLSYYEGVELTARRDAGDIRPVSDEEDAALFEMAHQLLIEAGYEHYEISNYARPGRRCAHNAAVWRREAYLGLGASAHSCIAGRRWHNPPDWIVYSKGFETGQDTRIFDPEAEAPESIRAERLLLGLRTREGVDLGQWPDPERAQWLQRHGEWIEELIRDGLAQYKEDRLALTWQGWLLYDTILERLI